MGWRRTGIFQTPQEVLVMTCDVCERDIGHEDGRRPKPHFEVCRLPNPGTLGDRDPTVYICSVGCLRAFAATTPDPGSRHGRPHRPTERDASPAQGGKHEPGEGELHEPK